MENTSDFFSLNLKRLRKSLDLTQLDLAELVGVSMLTIQRYESGDRFPRQNILKALAQVLKTTEASLLDDPNKQKKNNPSTEEIAEAVVKKLAESQPTVSKQDTKNLSEKDRLILEITSSLPLLDVNNLKVIRDRVLRKSPSLRSKKSVNS